MQNNGPRDGVGYDMFVGEIFRAATIDAAPDGGVMFERQVIEAIHERQRSIQQG